MLQYYPKMSYYKIRSNKRFIREMTNKLTHATVIPRWTRDHSRQSKPPIRRYKLNEYMIHRNVINSCFKITELEYERKIKLSV